jgi:hypothetical protein
LFGCGVGLLGKDARCGLMVIVVRHGTTFIVTAESKENVKIMLGNIYTSFPARLVKRRRFSVQQWFPL